MEIEQTTQETCMRQLRSRTKMTEQPKESALLLPSKKIQKRRAKYQKIEDSIRIALLEAVKKRGEKLKTVIQCVRISFWFLFARLLIDWKLTTHQPSRSCLPTERRAGSARKQTDHANRQQTALLKSPSSKKKILTPILRLSRYILFKYINELIYLDRTSLPKAAPLKR